MEMFCSTTGRSILHVGASLCPLIVDIRDRALGKLIKAGWVYTDDLFVSLIVFADTITWFRNLIETLLSIELTCPELLIV
jgi:hypothetical protein